MNEAGVVFQLSLCLSREYGEAGREFVEVHVMSVSFLGKSEDFNKLLRRLRRHLPYKQRRN